MDNIYLIECCQIIFNSATYIRFNKWAENDTYGELIEAIAKDSVDYGLAFFILTLERVKHFSPVTQITEFR